MIADPQAQISDFTEMTDEELGLLIGSFFRAIGWGAVAGSGFFLVFTVPASVIALAGEGDPRVLLFGLLPLLIGLAGSLSGMIVIGLPLTALLRHMQRERAAIYTATGTLGGFAIPLLCVGWFEGEFNSGILGTGLFLGLFGAIAGGVTAKIWGRYRESLAHIPAEPEEPTANPYHEMIY